MQGDQPSTSQLAIIRWVNVGILLVRRLTLARCHIAHWADLSRCWSIALSPTSPAYANVMPIILFKSRVLPTMGIHVYGPDPSHLIPKIHLS